MSEDILSTEGFKKLKDHALYDWNLVYLDPHKAKIEKYVGRLCRYLAAVNGYRYWK